MGGTPHGSETPYRSKVRQANGRVPPMPSLATLPSCPSPSSPQHRDPSLWPMPWQPKVGWKAGGFPMACRRETLTHDSRRPLSSWAPATTTQGLQRSSKGPSSCLGAGMLGTDQQTRLPWLAWAQLKGGHAALGATLPCPVCCELTENVAGHCTTQACEVKQLPAQEGETRAGAPWEDSPSPRGARGHPLPASPL